MTKHNLKIGNVGSLTNGVPHLWRIVAIDGDTLTIEQTDNTDKKLSTFADCFWCLLDKFEP